MRVKVSLYRRSARARDHVPKTPADRDDDDDDDDFDFDFFDEKSTSKSKSFLSHGKERDGANVFFERHFPGTGERGKDPAVEVCVVFAEKDWLERGRRRGRGTDDDDIAVLPGNDGETAETKVRETTARAERDDASKAFDDGKKE